MEGMTPSQAEHENRSCLLRDVAIMYGTRAAWWNISLTYKVYMGYSSLPKDPSAAPTPSPVICPGMTTFITFHNP